MCSWVCLNLALLSWDVLGNNILDGGPCDDSLIGSLVMTQWEAGLGGEYLRER